MSGPDVHFSQFGWADHDGGEPPGRDIQELWFALGRRRWSSAVLVPVDGESSAAKVATALADVGGRIGDSPVTAIVADTVSYDSLRMLTDLQLRVTNYRKHEDGATIETEIVAVSYAAAGPPNQESAPPQAPKPAMPIGQVIVAIPPVVREPLGVAIAHAADAVVVCIELGRTTLKSARRTVELIGRDRIAGALLIR